MIHNWKHARIPSHSCFGLLYFYDLILLSVVQNWFQVQLTSRTTFLQEAVDDEDMTPMHTTMICAWNGVEEV
jgi:hypothetical protein